MTALLEIIKGGALSVHYQAIIQPHVELYKGSFNGSFSVHAYEALARGPEGNESRAGGRAVPEYVRRKREESAVDRLCAALALRTRDAPIARAPSTFMHRRWRDRDFVRDLRGWRKASTSRRRG
jgi:hypothetical protein